jgi:hypothetical protein
VLSILWHPIVSNKSSVVEEEQLTFLRKLPKISFNKAEVYEFLKKIQKG